MTQRFMRDIRHTRNLSDVYYILLLLMIVFVMMLTSPAKATELDDILVKEPVTVSNFMLIDHMNRPFTQQSLKGKWTIIFFGYTHCPDVCPVSMHEMDKLISALPQNSSVMDQFQFVFVSVDPARDTPQYLASYVKYFNPLIVGATGEMDELKKFTSTLKIKFSKGDGTATEYTVNHSSAMLLIDPKARYYARFPAPHDVDRIYQWLREISHLTDLKLK